MGYDFGCVDCGVSTVNEWYMVDDDVWAGTGMGSTGCLCLGCLEQRLGGPLSPDDLARAPINVPGYFRWESDRLAELKRAAAPRLNWPRLWPLATTPDDVREFVVDTRAEDCTCVPFVFWRRVPPDGTEVGLDHRAGCPIADDGAV